jgi:hypothetical protein
MGTIYLDQNFVSNVVRSIVVADPAAERARAAEIVAEGTHRFVISVWNMYETARAPNQATREECTQFIERITPHYCANPRLVQVQELVRYLAGRYDDQAYRVEDVTPFCETPARMWATFASPANPATPFVGESFRDGVDMLMRSDLRKHLDVALDDGPAAAAVGRKALKVGDVGRDTQLIDRAWLTELLPERNQGDNTWIEKGRRESIADFFLERIGEVYEHCPSFHAEEQTFRHRITSNRKLQRSDGVDVQFFVLAVAYCDFLITSDRALREMFVKVAERIGSSCQLLSSLADV